ncbi:MAG: hypothetical protein C5B49_16335 [Bdellovibrio sp.]|nr:MAG: hypothetical protein C5B49_16335 [Bdellovibrio sp.]
MRPATRIITKNRYELRLLFKNLMVHVGRKPPYLTKLCDLSIHDGIFDQAFHVCDEAIHANPR